MIFHQFFLCVNPKKMRVPFVLTWKCYIVTHLDKLVPWNQNWRVAMQGYLRPSGAKQGQMGPNGVKRGQKGLTGPNVAKRAKWGQTRPNGVKWGWWTFTWTFILYWYLYEFIHFDSWVNIYLIIRVCWKKCIFFGYNFDIPRLWFCVKVLISRRGDLIPWSVGLFVGLSSKNYINKNDKTLQTLQNFVIPIPIPILMLIPIEILIPTHHI